jgi:uncharacterized protein YdaU (DUF1376 family)
MPNKKVDIWMPIYIGDYLSDTMHLTTAQHGAYLLLLMAYWKNKGPLPNNDVLLSQVCRMSLEDWNNAKPMLMKYFFVDKKGNIINKRADKEIGLWCEKKRKYVERAKKAAGVRWKDK